MHFAVIGASGYIGRHFARQVTGRGYQLTSLGRKDCDLYSASSLEKAIREASPDVVVNCAGYTGKPNVDACELDKTNCLAGNAILPGVIAEACRSTDVAWGHVSSGCIYTGKPPDGSGFTESDPPNFSFRQGNCSFYSGTKALGEELIAEAPKCYRWRLRIPFSNIDSSRNYLSKLQRYDTLLEAENSLSEINEFVAACLDCFELGVPYGVYNLTNPGSVTTSEVVQLIRQSGVIDREYKFFSSEAEFMQTAASTPRSNCVLDSSKAIAAGLKLSPIAEAIERALADWSPEEQPTHMA